MQIRLLVLGLALSATVLASGCCTTHPWCNRWCAPRAAASPPGCCPPGPAGVPALPPGNPPGAIGTVPAFAPLPPNGFNGVVR